jgi:DNA-binding response OmpR family regulator
MKINFFGAVKKRILLVNCDECLLSILRSRLNHAGFEVETAAGSGESLEAMRGKPPHLVLLDVVMPSNDGFGILSEIRSDKRLKAVPVFVMAGEQEIDSIEKALHLGANHYVVKPFNPNELVGKIRKTIGK